MIEIPVEILYIFLTRANLLIFLFLLTISIKFCGDFFPDLMDEH